MSEKSNRRTNFLKQNGIRAVMSWIILLLFLVKMIYMSYRTGMTGMTFYAYADAVFIVIYLLLGVAVLPILKKMLCFQFNHGNYKNAAKVYRIIFGFLFVMAVVTAVVLFFFSQQLSLLLFGTKLCSLLFRIIAFAAFFWILMFGMKGYMEGIGNAMPGIFADVLAHVIGLIITVLTQPAFSEYGRKVAALMRQDAYAYAYSVCSGALGLAIGGLFGFVFLWLIRTFFGKDIRRRIRSDEARKTDSAQDILWNFSSNYVKTTYVDHIGVLLAVILIVVYSHMPGINEGGAGMIYMGMVVMVLPPALLAWQMGVPFTRQLHNIMKQLDYHHAKERLSFYLKLLSYMVLPYVTIGFALAPLLAKFCFDVENEQVTSMFRIGMVGGLLVVYGVFFRQVLSVVVKPYLRNICAGMLGISGIVFLIILKYSGMPGEECVAYAYVLACLFFLLLACFFVLKKIRIYQNLLESVALPCASALFAAAVVFGLYILIETKMQPVLVLVLCVAVAYILHNLVITFLGVFKAHEWNEVPAADLPVALAKLFGKY